TAFALVTLVGLLTVILLLRWVPHMHQMPVSHPIAELSALRRSQVWFTLVVGMVGFGGMFAVYTYISTTLTDVAGLPLSFVPLALMLYGLGMVAGNIFGGYVADRALLPGLAVLMVLLIIVLALFIPASHHPISALVVLFFIGVAGSSLVPGLQTRLMDVAHEAQTLAASLNHSALNIANAGGAWLGGLVIAAGYGYTAPAAVGAGLALAGLIVLGVAVAAQRRAIP
ncbi:MAG: MFS transporter, partial [Mycobacteriaceae bacterium]